MIHWTQQACDLSSVFNMFGLFGTGADTGAHDRSVSGGDDYRSSKNNKFETMKRTGNQNTSSSSSSGSGGNTAVRGDTFKNIKLTPELEATRRRVEDELTVKMEKQSDIQEQRERNARSPMLTSIGNIFGFGSNGGRDGGLSSVALGGGGGGGGGSSTMGGGSVFGIGSPSLSTPRSASAGRYSSAKPDSRGASMFSGFSSEKAPSVSSNRSGRSLVSAGGERGVQDAFERVLGTDGLDVTVYLTSREGDTKSKRAVIKREKNSSTVYVEIKSRPKRPGEKEAAKRLKFDLATDVMMVAKGKGSGRGPNDAKVPRSVDDNCVLHFILKGKPELNVEVDGGTDSRDAVLTGFMQLISRHRSAASSGRGGGGGGNGAVASSNHSGGNPPSTAFFT